MNTCGTCKFWDIEAHRIYPRSLVGECTKMKMFWDCTEWSDDADCTRVFRPEFADVLAFVQDGSDYHAELLTKAEFYCAHWTAKPTEG